MAAPITHIVLADKVYKKHFSNKNKQEFFVGTSLPDIRYLGFIERAKVHHKNISLESIRNINSFDAGLMFHSLVDEVRERYMKNNKYYSLFPDSKLLTQASKVFEDRILYSKVINWAEIIGYFDVIYKEELDLGIKSNDVKKWHRLLINYFSSEPEDKDTITFTIGMGFPTERAEEIVDVILKADVKKAKQIVLEFYNDFEKLL